MRRPLQINTPWAAPRLGARRTPAGPTRPATRSASRSAKARNAPQVQLPVLTIRLFLRSENNGQCPSVRRQVRAPPSHASAAMVGRMTLRCPSTATAVFGRSSRDSGRRSASCAPGPNAYNVAAASSGGRVLESRLHNAPSYSFGSSARAAGRRAPKSPGPGNYAGRVSAVGVQPLSSKPNAPRAKFGTSARDGVSNTTASPGPNAYSSPGAVSDAHAAAGIIL